MSHLLLILLCTASLVYPAAGLGGEPAKNIIFMVSDGMGLAQVTAARIFKNGPGGAPLALETLERVGYQRTYSKNSTVTDSAAAASAWACGEKFNNGEVCFHRETGSYSPTILELAKGMGKATGLVVTSQITDATPAGFAAHVANRKCQNEIGRQYIQVVRPHVILGGGRWKMDADPATDGDSPGCPFYGKDLEEEAARTGYRVVHTGKELEEALNEGPREILGLFSNGGMTPAYKRTPETTEPSLAEMTRAALTVLEKERKGFLLLVEGSQVDWANHENNLAYQVPEILAFDEAVRAVLEWVSADRLRTKNTLVIIAPDHDTGGFAINGPQKSLSTKGDLSTIESGWTSKRHTGGDVPLWSVGPGSEWLGRALDNTDLYGVMKRAMTVPALNHKSRDKKRGRPATR